MAVEAVVGEVDLPAHEPLRAGSVPFQTLSHGLNQCSSLATSPQNFSGCSTDSCRALVLFQALDVGLFLELRGWLELALLLQS